MRLDDLFEAAGFSGGWTHTTPKDVPTPEQEDETAHWAALRRTGFYGAAGAGAILMAEDTKRFLVGLRSKDVEQPGTWGTFGGAIDAQENPQEAMLREVRQETGYHGHCRVLPLFVFQKGTFRYHNFLVVVPEEFVPRLNWENDEAIWCRFGDWPRPVHFGLKAVLDDAASLRTLERAAAG